MKKSTKRRVGGMALAAGVLGAAGAYLAKRKGANVMKKRLSRRAANVWARPGMAVTFRAELKPGRDREERTVRVKELLPSGRVLLDEISGEHAENEFERTH